MVEFINLRQGGMSVLEYSLKFTKFSKYDPSLVSNPRDEMSRFLMGVLDYLQKECHSAMLHDNMNISGIMVHAEHVEEARSKSKSGMVRGQDILMEVLQTIGLRYKTSLYLKSGFLVKFLPSYLSL